MEMMVVDEGDGEGGEFSPSSLSSFCSTTCAVCGARGGGVILCGVALPLAVCGDCGRGGAA